MADDYKVPYTKILAINPHDNAERLEVATVYGFQVIVGKGQYQVGDKAIYIPIDSILPDWLEKKLFPEGSKVTLHNHRVRQIRLRGLASQGMLVSPDSVSEKVNPEYFKDEQDLSEILGVTKYEPPIAGAAQTIGKRKNRNKKRDNPLFHKYNGLNNIKWFPDLFVEGDNVVIQEKLHGTNARISILPYNPSTLWKKLKKWCGLAPHREKCYGSNNVEISNTFMFKGYYGEDLYGKCFKENDVFNKILVDMIVFGEIVGPGIQKNYEYSLDKHKFVVFDIKVLIGDGKFEWLNPEQVEEFCRTRGLDYVPVLYVGPYNKEMAYSLTKGVSAFDPKTKVREGIVIKAASGYSVEGNKKAVKWVSEAYLDDKSNTDFH